MWRNILPSADLALFKTLHYEKNSEQTYSSVQGFRSVEELA